MLGLGESADLVVSAIRVLSPGRHRVSGVQVSERPAQ